MFPGVLLHKVKAPLPVDFAGDGSARLQSSVAGVDHPSVPVMYLQNPDTAQNAGVIGLSAPLGVEGGLVQDDVVSLLALDAGLHHRVKGGEKGICFVEPFHK